MQRVSKQIQSRMRGFFVLVVACFASTILFTACASEASSNIIGGQATGGTTGGTEDGTVGNTMKIINMQVGSREFTAQLADNAAANAFAEMLPMTINMGDMNSNEKYYYLPRPLPTNSSRAGQINNGDLMLYGNNCLVLFYETFSSSYSYTRIGRIENVSGLVAALGSGGVTVTFSAVK